MLFGRGTETFFLLEQRQLLSEEEREQTIEKEFLYTPQRKGQELQVKM